MPRELGAEVVLALGELLRERELEGRLDMCWESKRHERREMMESYVCGRFPQA